jgi:hypothetical protein
VMLGLPLSLATLALKAVAGATSTA